MIETNPYRIIYFKEEIDMILNGLIPPPVMVEFFLTNKCNHKCIGCLFDEHRKKNDVELPYEKVLKTVRSLKDKGVRSVEFCGGGEPTLHSRFDDLVEECRKSLKLGLITNGSLLGINGRIEKIVEDFSYIRISIDAGTKEMHNKIHKSNDFEKIKENVLNLAKEKKKQNSDIQIGVKFLLFNTNYKEIKTFCNLFAKHVDSVQFKYARETDDKITESFVNVKIMNDIEVMKSKYDNISFYANKSVLETPTCIANLLSCFVDASGDVDICCYFQGRKEKHKFGNINKKDFWDIWYSQEHMNKLIKIDPKECNMFDCRYHFYNKIMYELKEKGGVYFV